MRRFDNAREFYNSKEWRTFRAALMHERTGSDGLLPCEHCHKPILRPADCIAHHMKELSSTNLNDINISLNPKNVMLVHAVCHNEIHDRWGGRLRPWQRKAYIVFAPPLGDAEAYVRGAKGRGDLILDVDALWRAMGQLDGLDKPRELNGVVFPVRDLIIDKINLRAGTWQRAWILSAEPYPGGREELLRRTNGEGIYLDDISESECLEKLYKDPAGRDVNLYTRLIKEWFAQRRAELARESGSE